MANQKQTLIIHTGGIGDFLLTCPTIESLAKEGPITLAGYQDRLALAVAGGIAVKAHDLSAMDFQSIFANPSETFYTFVKPFDRVIVWMNDPDNTIAAAFRNAGITDIQIHPGLPPKNWKCHASDYYRECLNIPDTGPFQLHLTPGSPKLDIVIHTGSGSPKKNTPLEMVLHWATVLCQAGRRITWCIGPAEQERLSQTELAQLKEAGDRNQPFLESESLVDLAHQLTNAQLYIGNDSGITHLAAALGIKTIANFRTTNPVVWAPQGKHVIIKNGKITPEEILGDTTSPTL